MKVLILEDVIQHPGQIRKNPRWNFKGIKYSISYKTTGRRI